MLIWLIAVAAGLYVAYAALLYFGQRKLVFYPIADWVGTPDEWGLEFEDLRLSVDSDEEISAWYLPAPAGADRKQVVLFCHGNAGNISHRAETALFLHHLGVACLMFDYRGFGRSDGAPGEEACYADARAAYDWLRSERGAAPADIVVLGRSLGGAVAIDLATIREVGGLVVESSFTSAHEIGRRMFRLLPIRWLLRYEFNSLSKMAAVRCPVLVTHSREDELIPVEMGRRLYKAARGHRAFFEFEGRHDAREYLHRQDYQQAVTSLIEGTLDGQLR